MKNPKILAWKITGEFQFFIIYIFMQKKIVVYDSGIGGASILKEIMMLLPNYDYLYFADTKNSPYGTKTKAEILHAVLNNVLSLNKNGGIGLLVLACNTATSVCCKILRNIFSFPVVGVEPAIKKAVDEGFNKIAILATPQTLKSNDLIQKYIKNSKGEREISKVPLDELASLIDENTADFNRVLPYLSKKLKGLKSSCVVVGCTHYNFVKKQIQTVLPDAKIISCERAVALQVQRVLAGCNLCLTNGSLKIILSKRNRKLSRFLKTYLSFA